MSSTEQTVQVYQLRIWIREISPQIGVASWYAATAPLPISMTRFRLHLAGPMSICTNSSFGRPFQNGADAVASLE